MCVCLRVTSCLRILEDLKSRLRIRDIKMGIYVGRAAWQFSLWKIYGIMKNVEISEGQEMLKIFLTLRNYF